MLECQKERCKRPIFLRDLNPGSLEIFCKEQPFEHSVHLVEIRVPFPRKMRFNFKTKPGFRVQGQTQIFVRRFRFHFDFQVPSFDSVFFIQSDLFLGDVRADKYPPVMLLTTINSVLINNY